MRQQEQTGIKGMTLFCLFSFPVIPNSVTSNRSVLGFLGAMRADYRNCSIQFRRIVERLLLILPLVFTQSCASLVNGSTHPIKCFSSPSGATVDAKADNRTVASGKTPCTLFLPRRYDYTVEFSLPGYEPERRELTRTMNNWAKGGLYFYLLPGLIDLSTGAAWDLSPTLIDVRLSYARPDISDRLPPDALIRPSQTKPTLTSLSELHTIANRWLVCIGISKYKYGDKELMPNLSFAAEDARMFSQFLLQNGWSESRVKCLTNEQSTERDIRITVESWLTKVKSDDLIVLFWAGHAFPDPDDPEKVYFACYDTDPTIPATGLRMDRVVDILKERKAKNVVVLADTCHAGKLITRGDRGIAVKQNLKRMHEQNLVPKGWIFMVGADTDRTAIEHSSWSNGAFTHCLLEGLKGEADGFQSSGPKDGVVTLGELRTYLETQMPEETQKVLGVAKHPVITTSTGDPSIWNLFLHERIEGTTQETSRNGILPESR